MFSRYRSGIFAGSTSHTQLIPRPFVLLCLILLVDFRIEIQGSDSSLTKSNRE